MNAPLISLLMAIFSALSAASAGATDPIALGEYMILVNRDYTLSSTYEPDDLIKPDVRHDSSAILMREEAAHALEELFAAARMKVCI